MGERKGQWPRRSEYLQTKPLALAKAKESVDLSKYPDFKSVSPKILDAASVLISHFVFGAEMAQEHLGENFPITIMFAKQLPEADDHKKDNKPLAVYYPDTHRYCIALDPLIEDATNIAQYLEGNPGANVENIYYPDDSTVNIVEMYEIAGVDLVTQRIEASKGKRKVAARRMVNEYTATYQGDSTRGVINADIPAD